MLKKQYSKLPLKTKILLPLLLVFMSIWTVGTISLGYFFTYRSEEKLKAETKGVSSLVTDTLKREKKLLFLKARWVADSKEVSQLVAKKDKAALLRALLPLKESLQLDFIKVVDTKGTKLARVRQQEIISVQFDIAAINQAASIGIDYFDVIATKDNTASLMVGLTSVKSTQKILGGVIVGTLIDDEVLIRIRSKTEPHLVTIQNSKVTASTLPVAKISFWQPPSTKSPPVKINIGGKNYIAYSVEIVGLNDADSKLVLLNPVVSLEYSQTQMWISIIIFSLIGAIIFSFVVFKIITLITNRIIYLTNVTRKLASGDFSNKIYIKGNDEISILAQSFNYMTEQVALLLKRQEEINEELEINNQTLEHRVELRTLELNDKNISLQKTLQELQRTQAQVIQSEKMSSLGQMVAGVAHEINNPVSFVHGNLEPACEYAQDLIRIIELYQKNYPEPIQEVQKEIEALELDFIKEDFVKLLNSMQNGTERIKEIVLSLRNFSRLDEAEFKRVDIHEGIDSTLLILHNRLKETANHPEIEVIKEYSSLPKVDCYAGQLNQVFMNILANAIDALDDEVNKNQSFSPQIQVSTELSGNNNILIRIADNGSGIPVPVQSRLFDPFFTTKEVGKGTGLGLSISYQIIVDKHHGKLSCNSSPEISTEFMIEIPINQL
ncbi:periplasmic sensor signal transduction histidine kinase [Calothrix parasitica NIES-267]|uniref:histidine kinase n=1 Tax=Calothrix parasitica NIES-267 TaxID=1973488 RepID=A0A1Z4LYV0_9CYAN|nr:periplasmic sensor signal transduction histidine kinase [Calothrix parasitica NIES-267]